MPLDILFALKIFFTAMVLVIVPVYWKHWGPKNFLWFSDVALFGVTIGLWVESPLMISMIAVMVFWAELAWNLDLLMRLIFKVDMFGLTGYMFNDDQPLYVRLLSLFHVPLFGAIIYLLIQWGYIPEAFLYQIPITWIILIATYLAKPEENINWVYGWGEEPQKKFSPKVYFIGLLVLYPLIIMLSAHYFLLWVFG